MQAAIDRTKYLSDAEVRQLRTVTEAASITDLQHGRRQGVVTWALVNVALLTGLRVSEIARIMCGDIDAKRGFINVHRAKRRSKIEEPLAIPKELVSHLREFVAWKKVVDEAIDAEAPLFSGERGALHVEGLQRIWKRAIARAGLPRYSIHAARHTMAVHLLSRTKNLRQVQKQLGHADPGTTASMYADVRFDEMQAGVTDLYSATDGGS